MHRVAFLGVALVALVLLSGAGAFTALGVPAWFTSGADEASDLVLPGDVEPSATGVGVAPRLEGVAARSPGGPGGQGDRTAPPRHRITGHCVDEAGRGIPGARVLSIPDTSAKLFKLEELGREGTPAFATACDAEGRFAVEVSKAAPFHTVLADAPGFGLNGKGALHIGAEVTITLRPARVLRGRVTDAQGAAIAGARVRALLLVDTLQHELEARSGPEGRYVLTGLPAPEPPRPGAWSGYMEAEWLEATADGFAPLTLQLVGMGAARKDEIDLTLYRGGRVTGRVVDVATGKPVKQATVVAHSVEGMHGYSRGSGAYYANPWAPRVLARATAGDDGTFVIEHLPCDGVHGTSSNNGLASGKRSLGGVAAWAPGYGAQSADLAVLADGVVQEVVLELGPTATVTGRVVGEDGAPVAGANVAASVEGRKPSGYVPPQVTDAPVSYAKSGEDGRFVIPAAPADAAGPLEVKVTVYPGSSGRTWIAPKPTERKVPVSAGGKVDVGDLVLEGPKKQGPETVVFVETPDGQPSYGATLGSGSFGASLRTDAEGRVTWTWGKPTPERALVPIHLQVRAPGFAPTPVTLVPPPEGPAEVRVRLEPGFRLGGVLLRADGSPAAQQTLTVGNGALPVERALPSAPDAGFQSLANGPREAGRPGVYAVLYTDEQGRFATEGLPSGPYHVRAVLQRRVAPVQGTPPLSVTVSDVASDTVDLVVRLPPDDSPVTGRLLVRVLDATSGDPVLDAMVIVRQDGRVVGTAGSRGMPGGPPSPPPPPGVAGQAPLEPSGPGKEPGTYRVTQVPAGRVSVHVTAGGRREERIEGVEVVAERETRPPDVRLGRGVCVSGRVTLPSGEKADERHILFEGLGAGLESAPMVAALSADGSFSVCGFGPGRYRAVCLHQGFRRDMVPLVPSAGREVVVGEATSEVRIEGAWIAVGTLSIRPDDARLPPSPWDSEALTHERKVFGAAARLTLKDEAGTLLLDKTGLTRHHLGSDGLHYLPAGRYTVRMELPGGEVREESVDVVVGGSHDVRLRKRP